MRDAKRIKPFLRNFEKLWTEHPDLRFGQIVSIIHGFSGNKNTDLFYIEDDKMLFGLNEFIELSQKQKEIYAADDMHEKPHQFKESF